MARGQWIMAVRAALLAAIIFACYLPSLDGGFLWDDHLYVADNAVAKADNGLRDIWFSTKAIDYYPLTHTSFWLEWPVWEGRPLGYRAVNLGLHIMGALLVWALVAELRVGWAWVGAAIWAVHPVNVATVAWIAERKNVLSMVFGVLCVLAYLKSDDAEDARRRRGWYMGALACFLLALAGKTSVVALPGALLVVCWWRRGRLGPGDFLRTAPFFALSVIFGLITVWFEKSYAAGHASYAWAQSFPVRVAGVGQVILFYLGKVFVPVDLAMIYPREMIQAGWGVMTVACALVAGGILLTAWFGQRRFGRGPFAAVACFVLMLGPVLGFFGMSYFRYSRVADHYLYVPMIALIPAVCALLDKLAHRPGWRLPVSLGAGLVIIGLAIGTQQRARHFHSAEQLWAANVAAFSSAPVGHYNLGVCQLENGDLSAAEKSFREAMRLSPDEADTRYNLANVLRREGRLADAAGMYRTAIGIEPGDPQIYNNLGVTLLESGDSAAARGAFERALKLDAGSSSAHFNLYKIELAENHRDAARAHLEALLRVNPEDAQALDALSRWYAEEPANTVEAKSLALRKAAVLAEEACRLTEFRSAQMVESLLEIYLASGQREKAASIVPKWLEAVRRQSPERLPAAQARARAWNLPPDR